VGLERYQGYTECSVAIAATEKASAIARRITTLTGCEITTLRASELLMFNADVGGHTYARWSRCACRLGSQFPLRNASNSREANYAERAARQAFTPGPSIYRSASPASTPCDITRLILVNVVSCKQGPRRSESVKAVCHDAFAKKRASHRTCCHVYLRQLAGTLVLAR
jgi:hypothetical protein